MSWWRWSSTSVSSSVRTALSERRGGHSLRSAEEGKLSGILSGKGGITDTLRDIEVPTRLVDRLLARYRAEGYVCPCRPRLGRP